LVVHTAKCRLFFLSSLMTVVGLIFNTRAVSRMPLPLRAMSIICSRSYWVSGSFETSSSMSEPSNALPRFRTL
jgi:hypothetical protein